MTDTLPLSIQPVISYPKEAEVGKTYLMEIDLQMPESGFEWQYEEEEYLIYCMVNAGNLFTVTSVGEPAIVLHRFGGTYGSAKFLLEADIEERNGSLSVVLVNQWGTPIRSVNCEVTLQKSNFYPPLPIEYLKKLIKHVAEKDLKTLNLSSQNLEVFPDEIFDLSSLEELNLSHNKIQVIPEKISHLSNLRILNLAYNQFTEIPEAIARLSNLQYFDISNNQITEIPEIIESITSLQTLDLRGNSLLIPPGIVDSQDAQEIFSYLGQFRKGVHPLNEAKLIVVGQGNVGKTSLIERLLYNRYDQYQSITSGLSINTWNVQVNGKALRLNIWDFGGQEIYHATHQFFLTKRGIYLLVCNCRTNEEENRIEYWLSLIETFGGQSPVIVVGNKNDEQPFDINRKYLIEKYPNIRAIIETSCKISVGIDELRTMIINEVRDLKDVYNLLPPSWFEVKEHLEAMSEDFITYNRYLGICHNKNITNEKDQEELLDLLHSLGLVLNFRNHPILKDINVLKPDWITEGIYALLSDEALKFKTKGIFNLDDLSRILNPQRYPNNRHSYLIELMKEFELCFALNCDPPQFLIPGLLPKNEPQDAQLEGETLEFQYHYRILPESILSRFIVIINDRIYNQIYWRSGVMLQYQENNETYNIARIQSDPEDKKIFIAISGRKETRRQFLSIIRDAFKKIHNTFANLEISEWVPVPNHPEYPPLSYQDLLGLEAMDVKEYPIGKLKININIRKLLDGYESKGYRRAYEDMRDIVMVDRPVTIENHSIISQATINTNHLQGSNIANFAKEVVENTHLQDNQHIHQSPSQNLTQAAKDIRDLLDQLNQDYDRNTPTGQAMIGAKAIEAIEQNPTLKARLINALKAGSGAALEELVNHPVIKIVVAVFKGFEDL